MRAARRGTGCPRRPGRPRCPLRPGRASLTQPTRAGFTLAEVAVTLAIVAIGLLYVVQGINIAKLNAAHTRNLKLARDLAVLTLGQIEAGLYLEDIRNDRLGPYSYADEGYPDFEFEVVFGEETFIERDPYSDSFDSWHYDRDEYGSDDDEDEEAEEPYEEVEIKVYFPPITGRKSELILKRYMPWDQVYGPDEDAELDGQEQP